MAFKPTGADPAAVVSRLTLVDFHIVSKTGGSRRSAFGLREAAAGLTVGVRQLEAVRHSCGRWPKRPLNAVGGLTQRGRKAISSSAQGCASLQEAWR